MTDDTARAEALLKDHRASIDRLDAILVYTLGERFKHTQAVGKLKAAHDLPASDPAREARQIARLEDLARRADLDPEFAKSFLAFIIEEVDLKEPDICKNDGTVTVIPEGPVAE